MPGFNIKALKSMKNFLEHIDVVHGSAKNQIKRYAANASLAWQILLSIFEIQGLRRRPGDEITEYGEHGVRHRLIHI